MQIYSHISKINVLVCKFVSGIILDNLRWMFDEACKKGGESTFSGYLLLDEMSIQQDLQIVKRGKKWSIVGAVDLGPIVNSLDELSKSK